MRRMLASAIALVAAVMTAGIMLVSPPAAGAATRSAAALSWPTVKFGDSGNRVFAIQYLLRAYGYAVGPSGHFGGITRHDVAHFQRVRGLKGTGVVGASTWSRLILLLRTGSRGNAVIGLQQNLHFGYGYTRLPLSGFFGSLTRNYVVRFQRRFHIAADGIVGPVTWNTVIVHEK